MKFVGDLLQKLRFYKEIYGGREVVCPPPYIHHTKDHEAYIFMTFIVPSVCRLYGPFLRLIIRHIWWILIGKLFVAKLICLSPRLSVSRVSTWYATLARVRMFFSLDSQSTSAVVINFNGDYTVKSRYNNVNGHLRDHDLGTICSP